MTRRIVVVGGDATGMTAASTAKRLLGDDADVVVFERGPDTSYSACGIPYWVAGEVGDRDALVVRTPEEHRANGLDVRMGHEVVTLDPDGARIRVRASGGEEWHPYDDLVLATGAEPIRPDIVGINAAGVHGIQTLQDGTRVIDALTGTPPPSRAVVIGSGYVGLEMAEALLMRGIDATVVDQAASPLPTLDPEMGERIAEAMRASGVRLILGQPVHEIVTREGRVVAVRAGGAEVPADLVILGIGVTARSRLAQEARLPTGPRDAVLTEPSMRVIGHPHIWAGGDCAASHHRILGEPVHIPLGTHANKQGWVIGRNLAGASDTFDGVIGTAITRIMALEIARTGLGEAQARDAGRDVAAAVVQSTTRAAYYPGASGISVKMIADRADRRILGVQIVGGRGAALRIDTAAAAIWAGMTVDDLVMCDLAYAPPFSPVWDPLQTAGRAVLRQLG